MCQKKKETTMKKWIHVLMISFLMVILFACNQKPNYEGVYTGYSWKDESKGVSFEDATEYIESKMTLDKNGIIVDFTMDFKVKKGTEWVSRLNQSSTVSIDYSKTPTIATVGEQTTNGLSMFTIQTTDFMSFYAYGVSNQNVVALAIVDPVTRYIFEAKIPNDFNYDLPISALTIGNGLFIPTIRTSSGGLIRPTTWDTYQTKNVFNISLWSHVLVDSGVFEGITMTSTVKELLQTLDITFVNGLPQEKAASYGFSGLGGWKGNYEAIRTYLIGKNASEMTSLVNWNIEKFALGINDDNFFGIDTQAGGTKTAQDSFEGIAGATVRMSRESTSFQRALVAAGIITEDQVIKGRF
jgi:hypothetical protein